MKFETEKKIKYLSYIFFIFSMRQNFHSCGNIRCSNNICILYLVNKCSVSAVVKCLTRDRGGVVSLSNIINPSLILVKPRKKCPYIT